MNKKFYAVLHCIPVHLTGSPHAVVNTRTAIKNGVDGVFLISGGSASSSDLIRIYEDIRKEFPEIFLGINFLDISDETQLEYAVKKCPGLNALWMDRVPTQRLDLPKKIEVFGGVAFKYINPNTVGEKLESECTHAESVIDILTTSGTKTGEAPTIEKLKEIRGYLKPKTKLAVASGVASENVESMLPYVDIFLVATSILEKSKKRENMEFFVPEKIKELSEKINPKSLPRE